MAQKMTDTDRQDAYSATQTRILQQLDAIRAEVLAHGARVAGDSQSAHWGHIGSLTEISAQLAQVTAYVQ